MEKIAIFPAAGKLGSSITIHLLNLLPPEQVVLISRKPENLASQYPQPGVMIRAADYDAPETLKDVFNAVSYLMLISYPSLELEHRDEAHKRAIDAAIQSGVRHIFYTSLAFGGSCTPNSIAHVMQSHLHTEAYLRSLTASKPGFTFTAIREGLYSESSRMYTGFPDLKPPPEKVRIPHSGEGPGIAWIKIDDLGEATARLVKQYSSGHDVETFKNKIVLFSGPRAYTIADTVEVFSQALGKIIGIERVSVDDYAGDSRVQENLKLHGKGDVPRKWATSFQAVEDGETAVTSDLTERLLGRKVEPFEETIAKMVRAAIGS